LSNPDAVRLLYKEFVAQRILIPKFSKDLKFLIAIRNAFLPASGDWSVPLQLQRFDAAVGPSGQRAGRGLSNWSQNKTDSSAEEGTGKGPRFLVPGSGIA
jgi:hypothetical protein